MTSKRARPESITEYINAAPKDARKKLREMRACIRAAAPGAEESLKWGMPAFSYRRILVTFAAFKHHIGFYPTPSAVKAFANDLSKYVTADARAELLAKAGANSEARHAYEIAIGLERDPAVRRFLQQRLSALPALPPRQQGCDGSGLPFGLSIELRYGSTLRSAFRRRATLLQFSAFPELRSLPAS